MEQVLMMLLSSQSMVWIKDHVYRFRTYAAARAAADAGGKPLLNIGCPAIRPFAYPCGDVCLDVDTRRLGVCRSPMPVHGDVRAVRFADRAFGAAICFHVLEHLPTVGDAERALAELHRVADRVFVISPSRLDLLAWVYPEHRLWVNHGADGSITFEQR